MIIFVANISEGKRKSQPDTISWLFKLPFYTLECVGRLVCRALTARLPVINLPVEPMSKKDYIRIARALKMWRPSEPNEQHLWLSIAEEIAGELKEDNPRFDKQRFIQAVDC